MNDKLTSTSKFLSYILRHNPGEIGLMLDANGWTEINVLIEKAAQHGRMLTRPLIEQVVSTNDKQRFALSSDGNKIRANQGHSIEVDLALQPKTPPEILFHGTATRFLESIQQKGLIPGSRQHVHLSAEETTAIKVGQRHGKAVVLRVKAGEMNRGGYHFYQAENGVWLVDHVMVGFIEFP